MRLKCDFLSLQDTEADVKGHEEYMRVLRQTAASYREELKAGQQEKERKKRTKEKIF